MTLIRIPASRVVTWDVLEWLEQEVGPPTAPHITWLKRDSSHWRYGEGWRLGWEDEQGHWPIEIDDPEKATLFVLRWV